MCKCRRKIFSGSELVQLLPADIVLCQLRDEGFQLLNISHAAHVRSKHRQLLFLLLRDFSQDQVLSRLFQHIEIPDSHIVKHAVCQPFEAEHIDIHDRVVGCQIHKCLLCGKGKLLRHDHQIVLGRVLPRLPDDLFKHIFCFSAS